MGKLSQTSIAVVKGAAGNQGYYFGKRECSDGNDFVFISIWADLDSIKSHFGIEWGKSFLPEGYEEIIEACSVKHFRVTGELEI